MKEGEARSVLVVDDDDGIRETLIETLEDEGYQVLAARNGKEALVLLKSASVLPGLILLDLIMPVMDGRELRMELLKDEKLAQIPVVVITADGSAAPQVPEAGALKKPMPIPELFQTVAGYCGRPSRYP